MTPASVDERWETDFVVELRMRDIDGARIGDALEQVRSHCAESGQDVRGAFGDPVAYARSLDLPAASRAGLAGVLVSSALGLLSMFLTVWAVMAWKEGEAFEVTIGRLVAGGVLVLVVALIAASVRVIVEHPWRALAVAVVLLAAFLAAELYLTAVVVALPAPAVAVVGAALLIATSIRDHARASADADPVVSPVDEADSSRRAAHRLGILSAWSLPIGTTVLAVVIWLLPAR